MLYCFVFYKGNWFFVRGFFEENFKKGFQFSGSCYIYGKWIFRYRYDGYFQVLRCFKGYGQILGVVGYFVIYVYCINCNSVSIFGVSVFGVFVGLKFNVFFIVIFKEDCVLGNFLFVW